MMRRSSSRLSARSEFNGRDEAAERSFEEHEGEGIEEQEIAPSLLLDSRNNDGSFLTNNNNNSSSKNRRQYVTILPARRAAAESAQAESTAFDEERVLQSFSVPNPRTQVMVQCFLDERESEGYQLLEAQKISEERRSFFIGDTVEKNGDIFVLTFIHPIFVLLPFLIESRNKCKFIFKQQPKQKIIVIIIFLIAVERDGVFRTLEQVLSNSSSDLSLLSKLKNLPKMLECICDTKIVATGIDESVHVYRLNDAKLISWLKIRVQKLSEHIAKSTSLPLSQTTDAVDTAARIVIEYLPAEITTALCEALSIPLQEPKESMKAISSGYPPDMESKSSSQSVPPNKKQKVSATEKSLQQGAKGTKSITSFFAAKPK